MAEMKETTKRLFAGTRSDLVERYIVWVLVHHERIPNWQWEIAETTNDWDEAVRVWGEARGLRDPNYVLITESCNVSPAQLRRATERGEGTCQTTCQQP